MQLKFYKYQGAGNDFIIANNLAGNINLTKETINHLCNRKFGIGADGLILLEQNPDFAYFMKYYNSDGNESSMCGNGGRCISAFAIHQNVVSSNHRFLAIDGPHDVVIEGAVSNQLWIKLKMKDVLNIDQRPNHVFVLNTGSPHYIKFYESPVDTLNLIEEAKAVRYNNEFSIEGINVNFVNVSAIKNIAMRTYERGVEDETLSCGTGVTAAAICTSVYNNLPPGAHCITVNTPGGELKSTFFKNELNNQFTDVWLEGYATKVFEAIVEI